MPRVPLLPLPAGTQSSRLQHDRSGLATGPKAPPIWIRSPALRDRGELPTDSALIAGTIGNPAAWGLELHSKPDRPGLASVSRPRSRPEDAGDLGQGIEEKAAVEGTH